ncbi:MAG: hypothetical protein AAF587_01995 [Bacteroidota bacterium]
MKTIAFRISLILSLLGIVFACTQESVIDRVASEKVDSDYLMNLVEEYNLALIRKYGLGYVNELPRIKKAFFKKGILSSKLMEDEEGRLGLTFLFEEKNRGKEEFQATRFHVGLEESMKFPKKLEQAEIAFLENQLIIRDGQHHVLTSFLVPTQNALSQRSSNIPTHDAWSLAIEDIQSPELMLFAYCTCSCPSCAPGKPCNATSCSCSSGCGGGCSVTCGPKSTAVCVDSCDYE